MSLAGKITVDLIADHEHTVTQANLANPAQFFLAPDTSDRVVRTAKQEQFDLIFHDLRFQSVQIHRVIAIRDFQRAVDNLTPIVRNYFRKRIVHRLLKQYAVTFLCIRPDSRRQREYNARCLHQPLRFRLPAKALSVPVLDCRKIALFSITVAENTMFYCLFQPL